ncbi:diguanylate cyclase/phosphodiesterase [Rubrobacter xylanophilus DSM 9941]|uniref:Diguanylate cyclase/phosphodiesterase n=1 Tax=Rubrobacter xylanophilus (strain DSM 9941 / JCM 11954 / NBRC 16129 / PRD-1) TaxID=266117 RepID=Q1AVS2_RUBXD|nr:EAL domain-containing protein [Rubrobacter xylanophilus]ABG04506.1 diguanylate cyclase/phosphodiesterase [Rubrobacter xylanophilus DSM 9941]
MAAGRFLWAAYAGLGALATAGYFLLPAGLAAAVYILTGASSAAAVALGALLHRPSRRLPWFVLSLGPLLMSLADCLWSYYWSRGSVPYPSYADALYLLGYVFLGAGLLLLQHRTVSNGLDALVDPLMVASGGALLYWGLIIGPYVHDPSLSLPAKAVSVAYPLLDVLLLAALARYLLGFGGRVPALYLLGLSFAVLLLADSVYGLQVLQGSYRDGSWVDAGWLACYVLLGAAALHPSMRGLSVPQPGSAEPALLTNRRIALLTGAALTAPGLLAAQAALGVRIDAYPIAAGCVLIFALAVIRIRGIVVALLRTLSERERLQERLEQQALHDPLTGLANRALFSDRLAHAASRANPLDCGRLAVLMLDLDGFKSVNDSLGHEVGDALLVSVAGRIRACVRPSDTVARLGGDEFAVLIEEISDVGAAVRVAERILDRLGEPYSVGGVGRVAAASVGVAFGPAREAKSLLRDADAAMYVAKERGKGRYEVFEPRMRNARAEKLRLEAELRAALERGEFAVHYQPIVSFATGEVVEVEALVRWERPGRGTVGPAEFLSVAEESGLIVPIGRWVLREACRQVREWQKGGSRELALAVNLSASQLHHPRLVREVEEALGLSGLEARHLKLEITEQAAVEDAREAARRLEELSALGVRIALDDFGSGYSALSYLRTFPVDTLKIDRSFIEGIGRDLQATSIVGAVIALAKSLNMCVTAEGTETEEQLAHLRSLGCDLAQGYYFSRPASPEEVERKLGLARRRRDEPAKR